MGEELNEQVVGAEVEAPETGATPAETTSSEATTETPQQAPDVQAQIDAAVQAAIKEYEGKGGHLAKLRSKKDTEIAALKRQLRERRSSQLEEAKAMIDTDPAQAAQILAGLAEEQAQAHLQDAKHQELVDWQYRILADLGADPEDDEEAAELVEKWSEKLIDDPGLTWDFQQAAAKLQLQRREDALKATTKELTALKTTMPDLIKAEVTKALAGAGIIPEPSGEGEPPQKEEDWRKWPTGKLIAQGLAQRARAPVQRTKEE